MSDSPSGEPIAEPFDRRARRRARDRAAKSYADADFLRAAMLDDLIVRATGLERRWHRVLDLGAFDGASAGSLPGAEIVRVDAGFTFARDQSGFGVQADEDRVPFLDSSFDLILSAGALDGVNDLPGALVQCRRLLTPGGVFLASFVGGASFAALRQALIEAEIEASGGANARLHPMVDAQEAPGLLQRAGFSDPVVEIDRRSVTYGEVPRMISDLRAMGAGNILTARARQPMTKKMAGVLFGALETLRGSDGRISVDFEILTLTGRVPSNQRVEDAE
ncbi:MAG: methyltransferase domain-containing protein [Pacificimonas sp.]